MSTEYKSTAHKDFGIFALWGVAYLSAFYGILELLEFADSVLLTFFVGVVFFYLVSRLQDMIFPKDSSDIALDNTSIIDRNIVVSSLSRVVLPLVLAGIFLFMSFAGFASDKTDFYAFLAGWSMLWTYEGLREHIKLLKNRKSL